MRRYDATLRPNLCSSGILLFHSAVHSPKLLLTEMFVGCSVWLCYIERPCRRSQMVIAMTSAPDRSLTLLCVTVTIYFRSVCEKQLSFHLWDSPTRTVGSNTVLLLVGQNHHPNGCACKSSLLTKL